MISTIKQPFGKNNSQCYRIGLRGENDLFIFFFFYWPAH